MKKLSLSLIALVALISFSGCSSTVYSYKVEPTPIKQGVSKYSIRNFDLKLEEDEKKDLTNKTYVSEEVLKESFLTFLKKELSEKLMFTDKKDLQLDISMNYKRIYNMGGNALNKPNFYYTVKVYDAQNVLLAEYVSPVSTTNYGSFKEMSVLMEIIAFNWDAEDEPKEIQLISKTIVRELSKLGS